MSRLPFIHNIPGFVIEELDSRDAVCLLGTCRTVREHIPQPAWLYVAAAHFADSWRCFHKDSCTIGQWVKVGLACADLRYDATPGPDRRTQSPVTPDVWLRAEIRYKRMPLDTSLSSRLRLTCENEFADVSMRLASWFASRQVSRTVTISAIVALDWEILQTRCDLRSTWNAVVLLSDGRFAVISVCVGWIASRSIAWGACITANSISNLNSAFIVRLRVYPSGRFVIDTRVYPEDVVECPEDILDEFLDTIGSTLSGATLSVREYIWAIGMTFSNAYVRFCPPRWLGWRRFTEWIQSGRP